MAARRPAAAHRDQCRRCRKWRGRRDQRSRFVQCDNPP